MKKNIKQILFMRKEQKKERKKERTRERKKGVREKENQVKYNCLSLDTIDSRLVQS